MAGPGALSVVASAAASLAESNYHSGFRDVGAGTGGAGAASHSEADVAAGTAHALVSLHLLVRATSSVTHEERTGPRRWRLEHLRTLHTGLHIHHGRLLMTLL